MRDLEGESPAIKLMSATCDRLQAIGPSVLSGPFFDAVLVAQMTPDSPECRAFAYGVRRDVTVTAVGRDPDIYRPFAESFGMSRDEFEVAVVLLCGIGNGMHVQSAISNVRDDRPYDCEDFNVAMAWLEMSANQRWRQKLDSRDAELPVWDRSDIVVPDGYSAGFAGYVSSSVAPCFRAVDARLPFVIFRVRWMANPEHLAVVPVGERRTNGPIRVLGKGRHERACVDALKPIAAEMHETTGFRHFYLLLSRAGGTMRVEHTTSGHAALRFFHGTEGPRMRALMRK